MMSLLLKEGRRKKVRLLIGDKLLFDEIKPNLNTVDSRYLEIKGTLLKHFEISVLRHIRFEELRKINRTTTFYKCICNFTPEVGNILKILQIFHNILLPVVSFSCLNRDQIFSPR